MLTEEQVNKVLWQLNPSKGEPMYLADDIVYDAEPKENVGPCFFIHFDEKINPGFPYVNLGGWDAEKKQWLATCVRTTDYTYTKQEFFEVEVKNVIGYLPYKK